MDLRQRADVAKRLERRAFLKLGGQTAFGLSLAPLAGSLGVREVHRPPIDQASAKLIGALEQQVQQLMTTAAVPGVSIAIIKDGALLWRRGFGVRDIRSKSLVDIDTVFEAASTSKPVFAYAVMKLCERGVLALDTPLARYTSVRLLDDPRVDFITARHVLSHTTGLPNWRSKAEPLAIGFTPGEKWGYSGEGYSYLQAVVARLTGSRVNQNECRSFEAGLLACSTEPPLDTFMKANLFDPFGMTSTGYLWTEKIAANAAWGHDPKGQPLASDRKPSGPSVTRYGVAGGMWTTPADYAKLLIEVVAPKPPDRFRLTRASLAEMLKPQVAVKPGRSWALGWEISHSPDGDIIRHGGGNPGSSCFVAASTSKQSGYVIMTNSEDAGFFGVIAKLIAGEPLATLIGAKLEP